MIGVLRDPLSRRRFLAGAGVAGGSAALLGACSDDTKNPALTGPDESDEADIEILNGALDLEHVALAAYKAGAGRLGGENLQVVQDFLEQEQEHAEALATAIRDADGTPNEPKSSYDLPQLRSERDVLRFAIDLEKTFVAAYIDALPKLTRGELRGTAAAILTNEAQHIAVLRGALGLPPAPDAFVTGEAR